MSSLIGDLIEPPDSLAAECLAARDRLRSEFAAARERASTWVPRPMPRDRHA
jgi:hypothetical protein